MILIERIIQGVLSIDTHSFYKMSFLTVVGTELIQRKVWLNQL